LATDPCVRVVELLDTGHSRFPVYGPGGVDDVVGVVAIADLITVPAGQRATMPISRVCHDPLFLPDGLYLREVLDILRQERRQLACVVDEYGGFAGVVTLEDVAEELVGSILDEDDLPEAQARRHSDGSWLVPGRWRVDEVGDATGIRLPDSDLYETVSGLVMHVLGRVPVVGDELTVGEVRLRVTNVARHVPVAVELRAATPGEAPR
jgi:CBS domain containing-hemolysin-like protein